MNLFLVFLVWSQLSSAAVTRSDSVEKFVRQDLGINKILGDCIILRD